MNELLIDTSKLTGKVTLSVDNSPVLSQEIKLTTELGKDLLDAIDSLLQEGKLDFAELDKVSAHRGPGQRSMALRTGIVTADLLALHLNFVKKA